MTHPDGADDPEGAAFATQLTELIWQAILDTIQTDLPGCFVEHRSGSGAEILTKDDGETVFWLWYNTVKGTLTLTSYEHTGSGTKHDYKRYELARPGSVDKLLDDMRYHLLFISLYHHTRTT